MIIIQLNIGCMPFFTIKYIIGDREHEQQRLFASNAAPQPRTRASSNREKKSHYQNESNIQGSLFQCTPQTGTGCSLHPLPSPDGLVSPALAALHFLTYIKTYRGAHAPICCLATIAGQVLHVRGFTCE